MPTYNIGDLSVFGTFVTTGINDMGEISAFWSFNGSPIGYLINGPALTTFDPTTVPPPVFPPVNAPNAAPNSTFAKGMNNSGEVVGYYLDTAGTAHGFTFQNGAYTTVDGPGSDTYLTAVNDSGTAVGYYLTSSGIPPLPHGLVLSGGTITTLDTPAFGTELLGINNEGIIVGSASILVHQQPSFFLSTAPISMAPLAYTPDIASLIVWEHEADQFGSSPPSYQELQTLINFVNPQYAYGQHIGVMDPVIYAYQSLGAALATSQTGWLNPSVNDQTFVTNAYNFVFSHDGTPDQIQHFVDQVTYFDAIYSASGVAQPNLIARRGAVFGQMLGFEAEMTQVPIVGSSTHV